MQTVAETTTKNQPEPRLVNIHTSKYIYFDTLLSVQIKIYGVKNYTESFAH